VVVGAEAITGDSEGFEVGVSVVDVDPLEELPVGCPELSGADKPLAGEPGTTWLTVTRPTLGITT
jgi:hypothetical protein